VIPGVGCGFYVLPEAQDKKRRLWFLIFILNILIFPMGFSGIWGPGFSACSKEGGANGL
jgi:hypothetical protein